MEALKINIEDLAVSSQTIEDYGFDFDKKDLKNRLKYLIKLNKELYSMEEDHPELQYGIGDTINILNLIKNSL